MYRIRVLSVALFSCLLGSCGDGDPVALVEVEPPANREIHMQPSFQVHNQEIFVRNNCTDCPQLRGTNASDLHHVCRGDGEARRAIAGDSER